MKAIEKFFLINAAHKLFTTLGKTVKWFEI